MTYYKTTDRRVEANSPVFRVRSDLPVAADGRVFGRGFEKQSCARVKKQTANQQLSHKTLNVPYDVEIQCRKTALLAELNLRNA